MNRAIVFAALLLSACVGTVPSNGTGGNPSGGSGTASGGGGTNAAGGGTTGSGGSGTSGGGTHGTSSGGTNGSGSGGSISGSGGSLGSGSGGTISGSGGSIGSGGSAGTGTGTGGQGTGTGGAPLHARDHCVDGFAPDPADDTMLAGPADYVKSGQTDTTVQPAALTWLQTHVWEEAHFQWHNIRRCTNGMVDRTRDGNLDPCTHTDLVPANQEFSGPGDGLEFLAMHRHMMQSMRQLYPKHAADFSGFQHFPTKASDVPSEWQADWSAWPSNFATAGAKADDPASHMTEPGFESEGAFGQWIQSSMGTASGLHGALHFKWVRTNNQDHGLGNQFTNVDNYMFWKIHGWIDAVWDRYRAAKGQTPNDQDIKADVLAQCRQMDQLALLVKPDLNPQPGNCTPAPTQSGEFVDKIRPIFESATNKCTGCHGTGGSANLTLGGSNCVKSSDIVAELVNQPASTGGQFKLIVPMHPELSWLYLKATGMAATAGCTGAGCMTDTMPQGGGGVTLTTDQQNALKTWINDGAPAPQ